MLTAVLELRARRVGRSLRSQNLTLDFKKIPKGAEIQSFTLSISLPQNFHFHLSLTMFFPFSPIFSISQVLIWSWISAVSAFPSNTILEKFFRFHKTQSVFKNLSPSMHVLLLKAIYFNII